MPQCRHFRGALKPCVGARFRVGVDMTDPVTLSGQKALESWEIQRKQECDVRAAFLADPSEPAHSQSLASTLPVLAGLGAVTLAATVLGLSALS